MINSSLFSVNRDANLISHYSLKNIFIIKISMNTFPFELMIGEVGGHLWSKDKEKFDDDTKKLFCMLKDMYNFIHNYFYYKYGTIECGHLSLKYSSWLQLLVMVATIFATYKKWSQRQLQPLLLSFFGLRHGTLVLRILKYLDLLYKVILIYL